MKDTRETVVQTILDIVKPERPDLSDHSKTLLGAGTMDSLDFASLLMAIEDEFSIVLGEEEAEQLASVDKLVAFIDNKRGKVQ